MVGGIKQLVVTLGSQLVWMGVVNMIRGWLLISVVLCLGFEAWGFKLGGNGDHTHEHSHEHKHDHSDVDHNEHEDPRDGKAEALFNSFPGVIRTF